MSRFQFPAPVGGLDTLINPLSPLADLSRSPALTDAIVQHGILEQRFGFDRLALEPSHWYDAAHTSTKGRGYLSFDGTNDYATATFAQTLGTKWTIRGMFNPFNAVASGTILNITAATYDPVKLEAIWAGGGSTLAFQVTVKDVAGNSVTITTAARTAGNWNSAVSGWYPPNHWAIVRDGTSIALYIGNMTTAQASSSSFSSNIHQIGSAIFLGATSAIAGFFKVEVSGSLVIANRVMAESEMYFPIEWPSDETTEADVLGNWPVSEGTGTTLNDLAPAGLDMTITGATWTGAGGSAYCGARGLGMHTHVRNDGSKYYIIACGRRALSNSLTTPSGALYIWKADKAFTPFYFGGDPRNYDITATADGFDLRARFSFVSVGDNCFLANGVDYSRCYGGTSVSLRYWGISAPPTGPVLSRAGGTTGIGAGVYGYCYAYVNTNTGVESGRSPIAYITATAGDTITVALFGSSDGQVTRIRVYRTQVGGQKFTLGSQAEIANGTAPSYTDTYSDAQILGNTPLPGDDESGSGLVKRLYLQGGPATTFDAAASAGGSVDNGTHYYGQSWYNPTTGQETGMQIVPVPGVSAAGNKTITLGGVTPMDLPDQSSGFTQMRIYRTKAGAFVWYLLFTGTAAATYVDTAADSTLSTTIETRALPPKCRFACLFSNRLIMAGDDLNPSKVYVSTAGDYQNFPWLGHDFIPHPGAKVTGIRATKRSLLISYADGKVIRVPTMGTDADLPFFLLTAPTEHSPKGGCIGHHSAQETPIGLIWLGRDGFYLATDEGVGLISANIDPTILNLNRVRGKYACSLYMEDEGIYVCWLSTGTQRLNEQAYVLDLKSEGRPWVVWNLHADAAGVLTDANEVPHYCFLMEEGYLNTFVKTSSQDGDGSGVLSGAVSNQGASNFTDLAGRVAPAGGDGGYPVHFVKSDGTTYQRWILDPALVLGDMTRPNFYPSLTPILSGSWTVYYHGIRLLWTSMRVDLKDKRPSKTVQSLFVTHAQESAGTLGVEYAADSATSFTAAGANPSLTDQMTSEVNIQKDGRYIQVRLTHQPPVAGEGMKVVGVEVEFTPAGDTQR